MIMIITEYLPYLLIGLGVGYLVSVGVTGGPTSLDYQKQDIQARKERFRMLANKQK